MTDRATRISILVVAAAILASGIIYLAGVFTLRGKQVANLERMRVYERCLDEFKTSTGRYPSALGEIMSCLPAWARNSPTLLDEWGHPISYLAKGKGYLLVSLGGDGLPDGTDYEALRDAWKTEPCMGLNTDFVMSDRGLHRACGK